MSLIKPSSSITTMRSFSMPSGSSRESRSMSMRSSRLSWKWGSATLHQNTVISCSVPALRRPPVASMMALISPGAGRRVVPLKTMCSTKWETPARSVDSYREPTPMKMLMLTERVWGISQVTTRRPFSRVVFLESKGIIPGCAVILLRPRGHPALLTSLTPCIPPSRPLRINLRDTLRLPAGNPGLWADT